MKFIAIFFALFAVASAQEDLAAKCCPGIPDEMVVFKASLVAAVANPTDANCNSNVAAAIAASVHRTATCYEIEDDIAAAILGGAFTPDTECIRPVVEDALNSIANAYGACAST